MKLYKSINVDEVIVTFHSDGERYCVYTKGDMGLRFVMIIPIIGNLMALLWWIAGLTMTREMKTKKEKNPIFSTFK